MDSEVELTVATALQLLAIVQARESALNQRELQLKEREDQLCAREEWLLKRENKLLEEEKTALLRNRADWEKLRDEQRVGGWQQIMENKQVPKADNKIDAASKAVVSLNNVGMLLKAYRDNGGVVPTPLAVAEVNSLQVSATMYRDQSESLDLQIQQIKERLQMNLPPSQRASAEKTMTAKQDEQEKCQSRSQRLMCSFAELRTECIRSLVPLMLKASQHCETVFNEAIYQENGGAATLSRMGARCATVQTKGNQLRQPAQSSLPPTSLHTLLYLLKQAMHAGPFLQRLMDQGIAGIDGCKILTPPNPTKNISRALEKAHSKYMGDYTRLLDYARTSVVCDTFSAMEKVLSWLCNDAAPAFSVCRIKDRISLEGGYDAESSGGNRDILLNGWLNLGTCGYFIVEIQIHLLALFELKSGLHVLYDDARVLGVFDKAVMSHEGLLSASVINKVGMGVVREVSCQFSSIPASERQHLVEILQHHPCPLQKLEIGYSRLEGRGEGDDSTEEDLGPLFDEWTLDQALLPPTQFPACTQIRALQLTCLGFKGTIPEALKYCTSLQNLSIGNNVLEGPFPEWLASLPELKIFVAMGNWFSGTLDVFSRCESLEVLLVARCCLEGQVPVSLVSKLAQMKEFALGSDDVMDSKSRRMISNHEKLQSRLDYGYGNTRLRVRMDIKSQICTLWEEDRRKNPEKCELDQKSLKIWPECSP